jgi:hypothetical protein
MLWGIEDHVIARFNNAGIPPEKISFSKEPFTFRASYSPSDFVNVFKRYYGPTMNAFEAAEKLGKATELQHELETLFNNENTSTIPGSTVITATFLKVTVQR